VGELREVIARLAQRVGGLVFALATVSAACGQSIPSPSIPSSSGGPAPTGGSVLPSDGATPAASPAPPGVVGASEGRLVWLVDSAGRAGLWTTDLVGGDARTYLAALDEGTTTIRDPIPLDDTIVFIADRPGGSELRAIAPGAVARLLLDRVVTIQPDGPDTIVAVRDDGTTRQVVRVHIDGAAPEQLLELPLPVDAVTGSGPFGVAVSPDRRTIAAGWVGGDVTVAGPSPATLTDVGAPLVVGDDGGLAAVIGRAGDAYLVTAAGPVELAPPDSDPLTLPGTGFVAWPVLDPAGALVAIEVRDVLADARRTYPAGGEANGIREFRPDHILLEATAFDPLARTVGYLALEDGRFGSFEATAPTSQP
jgi:hypothetical protein